MFDFVLIRNILISCLLIGGLSCASKTGSQTYPDVIIKGAMKNVMWKGELDGIIQLDTISNQQGLYGLGPLNGLQGELLIIDGDRYISKVKDDKEISIEKNTKASAPFFVYTNVTEWSTVALPDTVTDIPSLEKFIDQNTQSFKRPFALKLIGEVESAGFHIQNLPPGTPVSSPKEAHQGQVNYSLSETAVEIIGFFSKEHQGVFTHHDTFLHLHLITQDKKQMGHLDQVKLGKMQLYLPKS